MKRLTVSTHVEQDYRTVFAGFNEQLFLKLEPPGMKLDVRRFDGCKAGDMVALRVSLLGIGQEWISEVTEAAETQNDIFFVDVGRRLPFPFKRWQHTHRIRRADNTAGSLIIDEIEYECTVPGLTLLLLPVLRAQFRARTPVYKREFALT